MLIVHSVLREIATIWRAPGVSGRFDADHKGLTFGDKGGAALAAGPWQWWWGGLSRFGHGFDEARVCHACLNLFACDRVCWSIVVNMTAHSGRFWAGDKKNRSNFLGGPANCDGVRARFGPLNQGRLVGFRLEFETMGRPDVTGRHILAPLRA